VILWDYILDELLDEAVYDSKLQSPSHSRTHLKYYFQIAHIASRVIPCKLKFVSVHKSGRCQRIG
jgi:hypothetical protein